MILSYPHATSQTSEVGRPALRFENISTSQVEAPPVEKFLDLYGLQWENPGMGGGGGGGGGGGAAHVHYLL